MDIFEYIESEQIKSKDENFTVGENQTQWKDLFNIDYLDYKLSTVDWYETVLNDISFLRKGVKDLSYFISMAKGEKGNLTLKLNLAVINIFFTFYCSFWSVLQKHCYLKWPHYVKEIFPDLVAIQSLNTDDVKSKLQYITPKYLNKLIERFFDIVTTLDEIEKYIKECQEDVKSVGKSEVEQSVVYPSSAPVLRKLLWIRSLLSKTALEFRYMVGMEI